jgi:hypothetical protein
MFYPKVELEIKTAHKSWYWLAYEDQKKTTPAFIEVPNANVCVFFAAADSIDATYVDDITDNRGYSLLKHEGFWLDQYNSENFQEWAVKQLKASDQSKWAA